MLTQKFILTKKGGKYNFVQCMIWKKLIIIIIYLKDFKKAEIV